MTIKKSVGAPRTTGDNPTSRQRKRLKGTVKNKITAIDDIETVPLKKMPIRKAGGVVGNAGNELGSKAIRKRTRDEVKQDNFKRSRSRKHKLRTETNEEFLKLPTHFRMPTQLTTAEMSSLKPAGKADVLASTVEYHMTRGITNPERLKGLTGVHNISKIKHAIENVHRRWKIRGNNKNLATMRGQLLVKYEVVAEEAFNVYGDTSLDMNHRLTGLKLAQQVNKDTALLLGLTQPDINVNIQQNIGSVNNTLSSIQHTQELREVASEFSAMLEHKRRERIEKESLVEDTLEDSVISSQ